MDPNRRQDICATRIEVPMFDSRPSRSALQTATVYHCDSPDHASGLLGGETEGYAYQRDGHPNANIVGEKCRQLHGSEHACVTASGQSAMTTVLLSQLNTGDHVLLSNRLYGGSSVLVAEEAIRFGIESSSFDCLDLRVFEDAFQTNTKLVVVETISNPTLRVADLKSLATIAHEHNALLVVDNTFATPILCRPLEWGADFVLESLTKFMNGHGDAMLGAVCGKEKHWKRVPQTIARWGLAASPFDCWMTERGLETLFVRMQMAAKTCQAVFQRLQAEISQDTQGIERIDFPGAPSHPDYSITVKQFANGPMAGTEPIFGNMLTLHLSGGWSAASRFIEKCKSIPYCPTLGETVTTLSHPASSSHRNLNESELKQLGMSSGTIRVSVGLESPEFIADAIAKAAFAK